MTPQAIAQDRLEELTKHPNRLWESESDALAAWIRTLPRDYTNLLAGLDASNSAAEVAAIFLYADDIRRMNKRKAA